VSAARRSTGALLLAALMGLPGGCAASGEQILAATDSGRVPASAETARPSATAHDDGTSAFHEVAIEQDRSSDVHSHLTPCDVQGRTMICGGPTPLIATSEGLDEDTVLAGARQHDILGRMDGIHGRWPDAVWLVTWDDTLSPHRHAYRWAVDHWAKAGAWSGGPSSLALFHEGLVVSRVNDPQDFYAPEHVGWFAPDGTEKPAPTTRLTALPKAASRWRSAPNEVDALLSIDGSLFRTAQRGKPDRLVVERIAPDGSSDLTDLTPRPATAHLWARSARDVVAFGGSTHANEMPVLTRFDGDHWTPLEPPPGVDMVVAYGRSSQGTERAFAYRGDELSAWERAAGSTPRWRRIAFPLLGPDETVNGQWVTDEDAWLHVASLEHAGRLFRLQPVTHVYHLGRSPEIEPVPAGGEGASGGRLAAAPLMAAPPAATVDPSPFRDAVVSYPDKRGAELPNGLRLCPFRGRTFVCGVSDAPLVSTDTGVVDDEALEQRIAIGSAMPFEGGVAHTFGSWPNNAWVVTTSFGGIPELHTYRHVGDAWVPFAAWRAIDERAVASLGGEIFVSPAFTRPEDLNAPLYPVGVVRGGAARASAVSTRLVQAKAMTPESRNPVVSVTSTDDALFVAATRGTKLAVERRSAGNASSMRVDDVLDIGVGAANVAATVWATSASDAVLFGSFAPVAPAGASNTPVLSRFDGAGWTSAVVPSGIERVVAYDRTSRGAERIFTYHGATLSLFERAPGSPRDEAAAWTPVLLPALSPGDVIREVWLANDDAWVLVQPADSHTNPPRLMRMQPVQRVWAYPRELPQLVGW